MARSNSIGNCLSPLLISNLLSLERRNTAHYYQRVGEKRKFLEKTFLFARVTVFLGHCPADLSSRVDVSDKKESKSLAPLTSVLEAMSSTLTPPTESKTASQAFALLLSQSPMSCWQNKLSPQYTLDLKLQFLRKGSIARSLHHARTVLLYFP